ncbi:MAG: NAD-dependent succinate-semialdehyde dehydrogenase [Chitinophagales bacterium]
MILFKSINPFDQSLIAEHELMDIAQVDSIIENADAAFLSWKKTSFTIRADLFQSLARVLRDSKDYFSQTISREMGKILSESRAEIEKCALTCDFYATHGEGLMRDELIASEGKKSFIAFEPLGAVFGIMPWNFPFWQVMRAALPVIMAGNVFLLKHAPNVSLCSKEIEKAFREAGFPENIFQSLIIDIDLTEKIISGNIIQGVTLTGSEAAGASVAAIAGRHIKKSVLELGGSDPFIVLEDAELDKAVRVAVQSRMQNAGQSCIAAKRFIVMQKVGDNFLSRMKGKIDEIIQGDQLNEKTRMGPMARCDLADKLEMQQRISVKSGAEIITGGSRESCNYQPTLLRNVKPGMPAFDEEMFGPIASVIIAASEDEALRLANTNRYGLGASIWTKDTDRGEKIGRMINAGSVFINTLVKSDPRLPFGGIKKSGYGRELSSYGMREFANVKAIYVSE